MSKRKNLTRGQFAVVVSMICVLMLASVMAVYYASMTAYKYGQNTIYIATLGEISASAIAMGQLYPGGTATTPLKFELSRGDFVATDIVFLSNYEVTSFTLEWGSSGSKTFLPQAGDNGPVITTPAGEWLFELSLGTGELSTREPLTDATMDITVPMGVASGSMGNPNYGYLVQSVTRVSCTFEVGAKLTDVVREDVLTVYQAVNTSSKNWTKVGYNATLSAEATKIEENSLDDLHTMLTSANGGNVVANAKDDYLNAVVYKDIDIVNIDIATGEPIGRLSDVSYSFEWYGGTVTLPANTVLASGRKLTSQETFTVDVYTYYPEFYIARYIEGGFQYISIGDKYFENSVKIDDWYSATFESTLFNPNGDVAHVNINGMDKIIPRSYVNNYCPLTGNSSNYIHTNYYPNASTIDGYMYAPTQSKYMEWATNLTNAWKTANKTSVEGFLPNGSIAQGENYVAYIYNWLYLVKYANNDAQNVVGYGNVNSYSKYNASGVMVTTVAGDITTGGNSSNSSFESQKGGAVIGCYNTSTANDEYKQNTGTMSYGYNYTGYEDTKSNNSLRVKGMYANQFLTNTYNGKQVLLDGYVGSDQYTSVFCLGQCNVWGNVWKWVFGNAIIGETVGDTSNIKLFTTFDNYNGSNWYMLMNGSTEEKLITGKYNYHKMSYNLPTAFGRYNHLGTSEVTTNSLQSIVGVQTADSSTGSGLADNYYGTSASAVLTRTYGLMRGSYSNGVGDAGPFFFYSYDHIAFYYVRISFRLMLAV